MPPGRQPFSIIETNQYGGVNTALQFSQLDNSQSPRMRNGYQTKLRAIGKRPGTAPVTDSPLSQPIEYLTHYKGEVHSGEPEIYGSSGTSLFKYNGNQMISQTMNVPLDSPNIYTEGFKNASGDVRMIIADGGALKQYDASTGTVSLVTPASDDPSPTPGNILSTVNGLGIKYVWVHKQTLWVSDGSDVVWYFKRYEFDYIPSVQYEQLVRNNDYVNGPGFSFNDVLLIPMRRGWNITTGTTVDDIKADNWLNTLAGVIAPRSIARITYPNEGYQTIAYLSDDGPHEIYNVADLQGGQSQYSTRPMMKDLIDWESIGFTEQEKENATGHYDATLNIYILSLTRAGEKVVYCYDTRNRQWYTWDSVRMNSFVSLGGLYFSDETGHLKKFDSNLYSDWEDKDLTIGQPVFFQRYTPLQSFEFTGFQSYWDYYLVESRQWLVPSNIDVHVIFTNTEITDEIEAAWKNEVAVYDVSEYDLASYANLSYTDIVNEPNELIFHSKAKYTQSLWMNNRNEPVEIYKDRWKGRVSGE